MLNSQAVRGHQAGRPGDAVPGFRVVEAEPGRRLALRGRHRFANYALTFTGANLTITERPITITADAKSKVYGNADPALTYLVTNGSLGG